MNKARTIFASAAVTASGDSGVIDNSDAFAGNFVFDITALTGTTPTVTFTVEGIDSQSGKAYTILASAALSAVATTVLKVGPSLTAAANLVANDHLPKQFRVKWVITGTTPSITFSVGASLRS